MAQAQLKARNGAPIDAEAVEEFAKGLAGQAIRPGDPDYDTARRIWNATVDRRPGLIVHCAGLADVVAAVRFARAQDLLVAVRGGGHNVGGRAVCDDGIVIDLSAMRSIFVDPAARTVRVQGGATLADLDRETHVHGLAVPTGIVSKTGIGGLALGGGGGWLVRRHGLTCDNALAIELVTAGGEVLTVNAETHPDLDWALRGGGGNFGIVTSFLFRAHPVSTVLGGLVVHARDRAGEVIRHYRDFMAAAPDELTAYCALMTTLDGMPAAGVVACWSGDLAEGERVLQPLRAFGPPLMDAIGPMPFPEMQRLLDGGFADSRRNYWKSTFLRDLSDATIDRIVEHGNRMRSPLSAVVLEYYSSASGRTGTVETAFAQRQAQFDLLMIAQWDDAAEDAGHIAWAREMFDAMQTDSSGGYLLNFLGEEGQDAVRAAFGANYPRLVEVKRRYDPTNFFSLNQNIRAEPVPAG